MIANLAKIGTTINNAVLVSSLNGGDMPSPVMEYKPFTKYDELADGHTRGGGLPIVIWELLHATPAQADALAVYCPLLTSANVVIYTRKNRELDEYAWFECIMKWDTEESVTGLRREKLTTKFIECVEIEGS